LFLIALSASAPQSHAGLFTLVDDNSSAFFNTASPANTSSWIVDGVNHLNQQAFWFRVGNVAETSLHTLPIATEFATNTNADPGLNNLFVRYSGTGFFVDVNYSLDGGSTGSNVSDMGEQITITNTTGSPLDFHFFQYVDFDINATPGDDFVVFDDPHAVLQYDSTLSVAETADAPEPHHREADFYNGILVKLNDGVATTLNDTPPIGTPIGFGDLTWAFQWDVVIAPFGSYQISKDKLITAVPEPAAFGLMSIGAGMLLAMRRKR
jgi:hypothetical protein